MPNPADIKYDLLKTELLLTQQQMDKYDQLSSTTKTWAVTLWVAIVGWTVQTGIHNLALVGTVITLFFWFFDGRNKKFRQDYKERRNEVAAALEAYSRTGDTPISVSSPHLPSHENKRLEFNVFVLYVGLPYITLFILSIIIYFFV